MHTGSTNGVHAGNTVVSGNDAAHQTSLTHFTELDGLVNGFVWHDGAHRAKSFDVVTIKICKRFIIKENDRRHKSAFLFISAFYFKFFKITDDYFLCFRE